MTPKPRKPPVPRVNIYTDASWCPDTKAAGYAFRVHHGDFTRTGSGIIRSMPVTSNEAEVMAIANAISSMLSVVGHLPRNARVTIHSDCEAAVRWLLNPKSQMTEGVSENVAKLARQVVRRAIEHGFRIGGQHVKGHTLNENFKAKANRWCDQEAKRWMRMKRKEIEEKAIQ